MSSLTITILNELYFLNLIFKMSYYVCWLVSKFFGYFVSVVSFDIRSCPVLSVIIIGILCPLSFILSLSLLYSCVLRGGIKSWWSLLIWESTASAFSVKPPPLLPSERFWTYGTARLAFHTPFFCSFIFVIRSIGAGCEGSFPLMGVNIAAFVQFDYNMVFLANTLISTFSNYPLRVHWNGLAHCR